MVHTFYELRNYPDKTLLSALEVELTIRIAEAVKSADGRALVVGGYPRDVMMHQKLSRHLETKDVDLEVYGLSVEELVSIIKPIHHINHAGVSFGVLKVGPLDVALPRKDSKTSQGHRGFLVEADPTLTHKEAARRRDFTINTLGLDPLTGELIDEWQGVRDIEQGVLRMVDAATFGDDPLRALRAMQFAGRFDFAVETDTVKVCRSFDLRELSHDRIGEEWIKLLLKADKPSIGLKAALELDIVRQLHPELQALVDTPQEPEWHPKGSVWNHTLMAVDVAAGIIRREELGRGEALTVMLGTLCHDMGKPGVTARNENTGRIRSPEHAHTGVELAHSFMNTLHIGHDIQKRVERIVYDHMFLAQARQAKDAAIRRLANRLQPATIQELIWVTEADFWGRPLDTPDSSLLDAFKQRTDALAVTQSPVEPLVKGRDLIRLGIKPGKHMGDILDRLEAAQLDGQFLTHDEGLAYYHQHIAKDERMKRH